MNSFDEILNSPYDTDGRIPEFLEDVMLPQDVFSRAQRSFNRLKKLKKPEMISWIEKQALARGKTKNKFKAEFIASLRKIVENGNELEKERVLLKSTERFLNARNKRICINAQDALQTTAGQKGFAEIMLMRLGML